MKINTFYYLALTTGLASLIDATFVIQKMKTASSKSSSPKSPQRGSSVTHGRSLISSISQSSGNKFLIHRRPDIKNGRTSRNSAKNFKSRASTHKSNSKLSRNSIKSSHSGTTKSKILTKSKSRNSRSSIGTVGSRSSVNILSSIGKSGKFFSVSKSKISSNHKPARASFVHIKGGNLDRVSKSKPLKSQGSKSSKSLKVKKSSALKPIIKAVRNVTIDDFVYVDLPKNQWTEFYFSEVGQLPYSRWTFDIPANQQCTLQVVDAYCTGDRFEATRRLDSGIEVPLLSTPPVAYDPILAEEIRLGANVNCTPFTTDAETAWTSSSWSKGQVLLTQPGNYKLILKSLLAPYGSGGAFVRLGCQSTPTPTPTPTPSQNVCTYGSSSIKYIRQLTTFPQQSAVCQSFGYTSLAVTSSNIRDARNVLFNCAGSDSRAWIASFNGDNYGGAIGLIFHATALSETGAITATSDTSMLQGVLCQ
jgi:hypothetical protein